MWNEVQREDLSVLTSPKISFLEAIAREEGFYRKGARPQRNNNPGDIEWGQFSKAHGAIKAEAPLGRFAVFPDVETGFTAMRALFKAPAYVGLTIAQAVAKWAPPPENDVKSYVENVCEWTGLPSNTPISGILDTPQA